MKGIRFKKEVLTVCKCGQPLTRSKIIENPACFNCKQMRKLKASKVSNLKRKPCH